MGPNFNHKIDIWEKSLLDFGKRNRLINFRDGKRLNVKITLPSYELLFEKIVTNEGNIIFPFSKKIYVNEAGEESYESLVTGNVETSKTIDELQKTLKVLRYRANTSLEEQGINVLFLAFGLLKWTEQNESSQVLASPVILVPVKLIMESLTSPFKLVLYEDEIVVNPVLQYKLCNDFGISLPEFDSTQDNIRDYFFRSEQMVENKGWMIDRCVNLTVLSFLKINMYKDLKKNEEKLSSNKFIAAIAGEKVPIQLPNDLNNFDHDKEERPIDTFQVVDADSSQQDAILLSKRGISFVLQGPPGTGKSQTITNIISEALADGKKVLFVSEKMAALQVVYNRMENVGLADFCLIMHSYKANKKKILKELAESIFSDRKKVREEALATLDLLETKRNDLNDYSKELHTCCSGLNTTIYNINGHLAKLEKVPDITFSIPNVCDTSLRQLKERIYVLGELSKTIGKKTEDYYHNVWRNSSVVYLSNELRHDIDSNIAQILQYLPKLNTTFTSCVSCLCLSVPPSIEGVEHLIDILNTAQNSPNIPTKWVLLDDSEHLSFLAEQLKQEMGNIKQYREKLTKIYDNQIFKLDGDLFYRSLVKSGSALLSIFQINDKELFISKLDKSRTQIETSAEVIGVVFAKASILANILGVCVPCNLKILKSFVVLLDLLLSMDDIFPTNNWFTNVKFQETKNFVDQDRNQHEEIIHLQQSVVEYFDKEIFKLDFYPILQRCRCEYNSFFRIFNRQFKIDMQTLRKYSLIGGKINYISALNLLNKLKLISDKFEIIKSNEKIYKENYGSYYKGLNTQWDDISKGLNTFGNIFLITDEISCKLKSFLLSGNLPKSEIKDFINVYKSSHIETNYEYLDKLLLFKIEEITNYSDIVNKCNEASEQSTEFEKLYKQLVSHRNVGAPFDSLLSEVSMLSLLQACEKQFEKQNEKFCYEFGDYYNGYKTDLEKLNMGLIYAQDLKPYVTKYNLPNSFIINICRDVETVAYCKRIKCELCSLYDKIGESLQWFYALFDSAQEFGNYNLQDLLERLVLCKNKKYLLEEWVDYCSNRKKCEDMGLTSYVELINEKRINADYIVDAYLKRFYRLWLDAVLPHFPAVMNFRGRLQDQTIKDFCSLDRKQFKIAQARVRERVINRIPDFNSITSSYDEVGILKRELNKHRKLMPLRKLFMTIPNLITSLRPCFMMSPLSVSVFLEAQSYNFDLVIFDEASQVHTEDAIGAIMRGKQVIMVGDTEQLPPTNFFTSSLLNDGDFDFKEDEDNDDTGAYESILREAVTVLPERSLRWHYRSRDESLIAFSNIKIYNGSLITFPSSIEKASDVGVEYVYVKDGIYDRSGKRNNPVEAKRVAELVFEHFKKHPNRSLGIVTFSEAQQNAIDASIRGLRFENQSFEPFFMEDKEEPFFIKNLENVQGDERDTIIFSIAYAKDTNGMMYMNFGPLSRDGGYRRLNVAITRAKYNVKLVGSINPTDIDLDKTSSEGVRLLRSYIEYAQQGIAAFKRELTYNYNLDFDSPFEECVYDFLLSKGYQIETQVGCSGFRIDMAVRHPIKKEKFAIGIECDGATYHSSRTARERDRLRQTILEDMGWLIYRIWSTDWVKDLKSEEEKLVNAVENSFKIVNEEELGENEIKPIQEEPNEVSIKIEEDLQKNDSSVDGYGFDTYMPAKLSDYDGEHDAANIIKKVIEIEQPIHFDELCRRVAPLFGNQKATSKIYGIVKYYFKYSLNEVVKMNGNFITLDGFDNLHVRIPDKLGEYLRPINYISDEEIGLALRTIIKKSFGITSDDLLIATAREFGFKRTGEKIMFSLRKVYDELLRTGEVKENEGKVDVI